MLHTKLMSNSIADKNKQEQLYKLCHDYLIDNFHKFTDANKLKVALVISSKYVPQKIEGSYTVTQMPNVKIGGRLHELDFGSIGDSPDIGDAREAIALSNGN